MNWASLDAVSIPLPSLFRFDASSETFFVRFFEHTSEIVTFAPSCAPTTRRCMEQPETRAGLLSPRRLYELAQVSSPRSSRYSNMLFYGAIIGTVIIIKSEAVCSRVSSLSLSPSNELVVSLRLIRTSRSRVLLDHV